MPIGPIGSTDPIGAMCPNELMPIGTIGSVRPIGAICTIYANWANWFHGPNWCDLSQRIVANWANWFHRPNWRQMYYLCHLDQLVPRAQLVRYVPMNYCQLGQLVPSAQMARYVLFMPIGPIGSTVPIGARCTINADWANWFHGPNWCDMSQ